MQAQLKRSITPKKIFKKKRQLKNYLINMRKSLILSLICLLCFSNVYAKYNRDSVIITNDTLGVHPWKKTAPLPNKIAHWSLSLEAGFSLIDADFHQPNITILPITRIRPAGGFMLEYDFTPVLGIAGGYYYGNYGVRYKDGSDNPWLLYGHMHSLEAVLTVDLIDAWFPRRESTIFSAYLLAGGGLGFYNSDYTPKGGAASKPRTDGKYAMAGFSSLGVLLECNLSRSIALGLRGTYHIHNTDLLDTKLQGVTNDYMEYVSFTFRWKMGALKKNHIRNLSPRSYQEELALMDDPNRNKPVTKDTVVISHVDTVYSIPSSPADGSGNGTPVPVVGGGETSPANGEGQALPRKEIACYFVYFENDKDNLDNDALRKIQEVSTYLKEDSSLCVEVKGFCDNTASIEHNESLSKRRAANVMNEFFDVYDIEESRIVDLGLGIIRNTKSSYAPNRRVEMHIVSYGEIETIRQQKDSLELQYNTDPQVWEQMVRESGGHVDVKKLLKKVTSGVEGILSPKNNSKNQPAANNDANTSVENSNTNSEENTNNKKLENLLEKVVEQIESDIDAENAADNASVSNAAAEDVAATTEQEAEVLATIKVSENTTLGRLARKYYNNGDLWPIIYEANRSVLRNPNMLRVGTMLTVPVLTEEQKNMSTQSLQDLAQLYLK